MEFNYVITGDGMMAMTVKSDLNWFEFKEYFSRQCKKLHPKGNDRVYKHGIIEFVNPQILTLNDFGNYCPALMGMK